MTTQTNGDELERKKFENWASGVYDTRLLKDDKGNYRGTVLQQMWKAWQAALSSKQEEP